MSLVYPIRIGFRPRCFRIHMRELWWRLDMYRLSFTAFHTLIDDAYVWNGQWSFWIGPLTISYEWRDQGRS